MKKRLLCLLVCAVLLAGGCTQEKPADTDYTATIDNRHITIRFSEGTASEGTVTAENGVYTFAYSLDGTFSVIYPNGYAYSRKSINGGTAVHWDYNESPEELGYVGGLDLEWAIEAAAKASSGSQKAVSPVISILLLGLGLLCIFLPRALWWISRGWMFKNVEPSDLALLAYRIAGIVIAFVGLLSFFA